jgi:hypothetical protein
MSKKDSIIDNIDEPPMRPVIVDITPPTVTNMVGDPKPIEVVQEPTERIVKGE